MGLFSSKKKVTVNTSVQAVFQTNQLPMALRDAMSDYRLDGFELTPSLVESLKNGIGVKGTASWLWAKDNYHYGTPRSDLAGNNQAQTDVVEVLKSLYGDDIEVSYYFMGPINSVHYAWKTLIDSHNYNPATNQIGALTASKGTQVYLVDIVPEYTDETIDFLMEQDAMHWLDVYAPLANSGVCLTYPTGNPSATETPYTVNLTNTLNTVKVFYEYMNAGVITRESFVLNINTTTEDDDYHQARVVKADGSIVYFTYLHGSGTYPAVDAALKYDFSESGTFLPWIYFRFNYSNLALPNLRQTEPYKDSHHLCRYFGLDYQTMADGIYEDSDLSNVIQSMLIFGIRADASSLSEREYLFRYFDMLYAQKVATGSSSGIYSQLIQDRQFKMSFTFSNLTKTSLSGVVAEVGKYATPQVNGSYSVTYRKQVTDSTYEEIRVTSPRMRYHILGKYGFSASLGNPALLIPLDRAVFKEIALVRREDLLARGLHFVMNTYVETETKWYQSGWFKWVLVIIMIVITILTYGGASAAWGAFAGYVAATVAAGALAVLYALAMMALKAILLRLLVKTFIDVAGLENTVFAAALMVVAACFVPAGTQLMSVDVAQTMVSASSNMLEQVSTGYGNELAKIQSELAQFNVSASQQWEKLQELRAQEFGLHTSPTKMLDHVLAPPLITGESPESFFNRTVHLNSPAVYLLDASHNYVNQQVTLPPAIKMLRDFSTEEDEGQSATV